MGWKKLVVTTCTATNNNEWTMTVGYAIDCNAV